MISYTELRLAARNHGLPLEALRYPVTPVGLHYLLTHYDIPYVDPAAWRLEVGGLVTRPLSLSLDDIRRLPSVELVTTMECAGNGRAHLEPRPFSQPWLEEAVGTGRWRGAKLRDVLDRAAVREDAVELVFAGLDRGLEAGRGAAIRAKPCGRLRRGRRRDPRLRDRRSTAAASARLPDAPRRAGLVRDDEREVARGDPGGLRAVHGSPTGRRYCFENPDDPGIPLTRMLPRSCSSRRASPTSPPGSGGCRQAGASSRVARGPVGGPSRRSR